MKQRFEYSPVRKEPPITAAACGPTLGTESVGNGIFAWEL